ncbi:hypothetical protein PoB_004764200 [Plakobranchus ocellatus]|uniref:Zasp-like motif domain-containing protein n=1 Tax=Plakobranchus ocellatus TaxID=259542 RepID=A0AAV4BQ94_9GAST|nr:hypothetical protein PoB_004764200 [Plakobranchus ocellatus]
MQFSLTDTDLMGSRINDDRKGSLTLRSDHMNYSRAILNSHWHQARQAEPKDYDLNKAPMRTMAVSTYDRIGDVTDGSFPYTTYQEQANQIFLKPMYEDRDNHKPMIQMDTLETMNSGIDRQIDCSNSQVLPRHKKDYNKFYLDTTYVSDYVPPYPFTSVDEEAKKEADAEEMNRDVELKTKAYKKMKSQFTDTADYRRNGWNTWQDESGVYSNSHFKAQVFPKTQTIPERPC